jgi:hypothetical protein
MASANITLQANTEVSVTTLIIDAYGVSTSAQSINYISSEPSIVVLANAGTFLPDTSPKNSVSTNIIKALAAGVSVISVTINGSLLIETITATVIENAPTDMTFVFGTPTDGHRGHGCE